MKICVRYLSLHNKLPQNLVVGNIDEHLFHGFCRVSQVPLVVKNPPDNAGDTRDAGSIPGSGGSLGVGHVNPLQYSYLEKSHGA